jgi:hypothetical protein
MKVLFGLIPKKEESVLFRVHEKAPFLIFIADILEKYKVESILYQVTQGVFFKWTNEKNG